LAKINLSTAFFIFINSKNSKKKHMDFNCNAELVKACKNGDTKTAIIMIEEHKARSFEGGLRQACAYGHIEIAKLMIQYGARNLNWGLNAACANGHLDIVNLLVERGAKDWDWGFEGACQGNHIKIGEFMISKGATNIEDALTYKRYDLAASILNTLGKHSNTERIANFTKEEILALLNNNINVNILKKHHREYIEKLTTNREERVKRTKHDLDEVIMSLPCKHMYDQNILNIIGEYISF
jgi:ankyrin repeat protein